MVFAVGPMPGTVSEDPMANILAVDTRCLHTSEVHVLETQSMAGTDIPRVAMGTAPISLISPTLEEPLPLEQMNGYLEAAMAQVDTIEQQTASMPAFQLGLSNPEGKPRLLTRTALLDTGKNINLMSEKAFQRDSNFLGPNVKFHKIRPFKVGLADSKASTQTRIAVQNASIFIKDAVYEICFLVMDDLAHDFIIGMPWMLEYNVRLYPVDSRFSIGVPKPNWLSRHEYRPSQLIDVTIRIKKMVWSLTRK
jgi:hypothetical protein